MTPRLRLTACVSLATTIAFFGFSCGTQPTRKSGKGRGGPTDYEGPTSGREASDYKEIQALYGKGQYEQAIQKLDTFEKRHPKSQHLAQVRNLKGMCYLLTKRPAPAAIAFKKSIESSPSPVFKQYVQYNLASSEFEIGQIEEARATLTLIQPDQVDKDTRVKVYALRSRVLLKTSLFADASKDLMAIGRLIDDPQARAPYATQLDQALQGVADADMVEKIYQSNEDSPFADLALYRLAQLEVAQGKLGNAEGHIHTIVEKFPTSIRLADAQNLQNTMRSQTVLSGNSVGLLLPMKGKFERFGQRQLQAIQLAFGIFNTDRPDSKVTLVIEDSGETAESALRALNNLYFKHHVVAVIGPLLSKGADPIAARAQELGLPMISLAQQSVSTDFAIPGALTPQTEALEIARYAIEKMGLKRFAIVHPRDKFGEQRAQAFWDAVESLGGKITAVESYAPNETDFRLPVDKLSGLFYTEARGRETEELAKQREEQQIKKRNRRTEQFFALKPIVDYDAVFIPDEPKVVGQLLPTFAYRDVKGVKFLGIATWHSPDLLARAQNYAEGATFVDAFFPEGGSPTTQKFIQAYKSTYNQDPGAMEALAYDAAQVLELALNRAPGVNSRSELKDRLHAIAEFPGVTGHISYANGQLQRTLTVLTIKGGQIVEASAGARGPGSQN